MTDQNQTSDTPQQLQQDAAGSVSGSQEQQFSDQTGQQGGSSGSDSRFAGQIREHMEVIGADGAHVGTVDHVDGDKIKLTKSDSGMGGHQGHHHYLPLSQVADIEGNQVRLSASGATAYGMESES